MNNAENIICPLCGSLNIKFRPGDGDRRLFTCPICGEYEISETLLAVDPKLFKDVAYILSGIAREYTEIGKKIPTLTTQSIKELPYIYPAPYVDDLRERVKKFAESLRRKSTYFGEKIQIVYSRDYSLAYAKNEGEFRAIIEALKESGVIRENGKSNVSVFLSITASGWEITEALHSSNAESEQGFVAVWFNESMNKSIQIIEDTIRESGFKPMCIRDEHFSERIMDKALSEIRKSRFVVIDLTGARGSVFFEAGFAFGLGIEAIYVYKLEEVPGALEFYVRHYQCYGYKDDKDLKEKLKDAISARIPQKK